jgi:putative transposase
MVWSEREAFRKEEGGEECDVLMRILQAYRFALDPSPRRERAMRAHLGARRFAYNWGLALVKTRLGARARGDDVDVPCNLPALRREWNRAKEMAAPWWREHSKEAYSSGLDALARGLRAFFDSREGRRRGRRVGFPVFRKKGGSRQSVRFTTGAIAVADRTHIILPRLGRIRTHEATTALAERIAAGTARILTATLSREGDRWFVSFNCEVDRALRRPAHPASVVGVDAGVHHLAVLSTGEAVSNPRPLHGAMRRIARLHRTMARRTRGSGRWQQTRRQLARAYRRAACIRGDAMHKLTTRLARTYGTIVVERLQVAGMMRNRPLARAIADAGLGALRRQLSYKCHWYGSRLIEADTFFPSTKLCSGCGTAKATLALSERVFRCEHCGAVVDRDLNAAANLAALVAAAAGSGPEASDARGRDVRLAACEQSRRNHEAGSGLPHQTGTLMPQGVSA